MKIIILGTKGMLGKALREEFEKDNEIFAFAKKDLNITDKIELENKIREIKPDLVINAVAYNAVDKIESNSADYELAKEVNGLAVGCLADVCKKTNIILVHYSTDYVFGSTSSPQVAGDDNSGYNEETFVDPISKYGETKVFGENLLKSAGCQYYLIRLSRLFGPKGESENTKKSFVDMMLDLVRNQGKKELDLVDEERTCPTYSKDLAKLTHYIVENKLPFGVYHGANSGSCTWYEFAKEIFSIKQLSVKLNSVPGNKFPRPAKRPKYSVLINTKLPLQRSWQEALKEYLL